MGRDNNNNNNGRGRGGGRGRGKGKGKGKGNHYSGAPSLKKQGLNKALGDSVFDYGQKGAADQMNTTWEKITHYAGSLYGPDITNELHNKKKMDIPQPEYTQEVKDKHQRRVELHKEKQDCLRKARKTEKLILEAQVEEDVEGAAKAGTFRKSNCQRSI